MKKSILFTIAILFVQICIAQTSHPNNWQVINLGSKSINFSITDTQDTRDRVNDCNYPGSNDVIYKFTTTVRMHFEINSCGSWLDGVIVYLHGSSGNIIEESDYNEGICSSNRYGYINMNYSLPAGTYYVACEGTNNTNGRITTTIKGMVISSSGDGKDGNTAATAIQLGSRVADFMYSDTKNTVNYTNDRNSAIGNDVFYDFTINRPMDITISHAGSEVSDTFMTLLEKRGNYTIFYTENDNSWDTGAGSNPYQSFIRLYSLPAGTYCVVSEGKTTNGNITTSIKGVVSSAEQKGSTTAVPIDIGTKSSGFKYRDTQDLIFFTREYTQCDHAAENEDDIAEDIVYKFAITKTMDITISHKELGDYSYIHLLNSDGNCIAHHTVYSKGPDDPVLVAEALPAGTYYVVTQGYNGCGFISTIIEGVVNSGVNTDTGQNYVLAITPTQPTSYVADLHSSEKLQTVQYYDGLGRPTQTVQVKAGGAGNTASELQTVEKDEKLTVMMGGATPDLISLQEYDAFGRESNSWLPVAVLNNNGAYANPTGIKTSASSVYNDAAPSALPVYEASPLSRVLEQYGPGTDWHTNKKSVKTNYLINNGTYSCLNLTVGTNTVVNKGNYANNQLFVTEIKDEDGNTSYEFKNKLGQTILTRQMNGTTKHDTYYVYDNYGNLCYVLSPLAVDNISQGLSDESTMMKQYAYIYKYDHRNRCIKKRIPGCDWIYYVYDKADRLIFTQDGEQRIKGEWTFNKYDALGRVVITGIHKTTESHSSLITKCANIAVTEKSSTGNFGYTWNSLPGDLKYPGVAVISVNYYDDYDHFLSQNQDQSFKNQYKYTAESGYGEVYIHPDLGQKTPKGLLTATQLVVFGSDGGVSRFINTTMYYDNRGRIIQTKSNNHLEGSEIEYIAYDFIGNPIKKKHVHSGSGKTTQTEEYTYTYDHAGRLIKTTHRLNGGTVIALAENTYDELGRLKTNQKHTHANLKTTYAYNVRSWTRSITNPLFNQTLYYNESYGGSVKQYSGNISAMNWKLSSENITRGYAFTYDNLSRLTAANYLQNGTINTNYKTAYTYDKHGNMKTMQRYGKKDAGTAATSYGLVDNLTMNYAGNQLLNANDAVGNINLSESADFKNYSNTATEYTYNTNGAMNKDLNKGISQIQYNYLNLPRHIDIKSSVAEARTEYGYSVDGRKLKVIQRWNPNFNTSPVIGSAINTSSLTKSKTTDYVGNKIYEDGLLKRILVDGGYIENNTYHFYITDHLGNNRVVANASGTAIQKNHYYPFGMSFAETSTAEQGKQPYKYNGKELDQAHGLNWHDYGARHKDDWRFTTVDPMAEKYYSWSPYVYVMNNPLKYIDPTGMYTIVRKNEDGTYEVIGGDYHSDDLNIYDKTVDDKGNTTYTSIGQSVTARSFYNDTLDKNGKEYGWMGTINTNDNSGQDFLNMLSSSGITLDEYIATAGNSEPLDFKVTNGESSTANPLGANHSTEPAYYRGMPMGKKRGKNVYASARDVGNIAAGYVAAANGLPWALARVGFDAYQSKQGYMSDGLSGIGIEGASTRQAQRYGFNIGFYAGATPVSNAKGLFRSIKSSIKRNF